MKPRLLRACGVVRWCGICRKSHMVTIAAYSDGTIVIHVAI